MSKQLDFDNAQICKAGHVSNIYMKLHPERNAEHCLICPEETISMCPSCNTPIRGGHYSLVTWSTTYAGSIISPKDPQIRTHYQDLTTLDNYQIPAYCHKCGNPYPWTKSLLEEANTIIDSFDSELNEEQRAILKERFPDLLTDNPKRTSAMLQYNQLINGLKGIGSILGKELLIDLLKKHVPETIFIMMNLH